MEGDTAMSKISEETIKCPKCGKESKFVIVEQHKYCSWSGNEEEGN